MPAQTDLILPNFAAVNKTFKAAGVVNGIATWLEKSSSVFSGYWRITLSMRLPTKAGQPIRHNLKLVQPTTVTETINGVTYGKITRQLVTNVEVLDPQDSVIAERQDHMAFITTMCVASGTSQLGNQVINRDGTT